MAVISDRQRRCCTTWRGQTALCSGALPLLPRLLHHPGPAVPPRPRALWRCRCARPTGATTSKTTVPPTPEATGRQSSASTSSNPCPLPCPCLPTPTPTPLPQLAQPRSCRRARTTCSPGDPSAQVPISTLTPPLLLAGCCCCCCLGSGCYLWGCLHQAFFSAVAEAATRLLGCCFKFSAAAAARLMLMLSCGCCTVEADAAACCCCCCSSAWQLLLISSCYCRSAAAAAWAAFGIFLRQRQRRRRRRRLRLRLLGCCYYFCCC